MATDITGRSLIANVIVIVLNIYCRRSSCIYFFKSYFLHYQISLWLLIVLAYFVNIKATYLVYLESKISIFVVIIAIINDPWGVKKNVYKDYESFYALVFDSKTKPHQMVGDSISVNLAI